MHTPLNLQGKEGRNGEWIREPNRREERPKELSGVRRRTRRAAERKRDRLSQRRASEEISGTEAKKCDRTETKGDRRRGSKGITKGEAASARTEGSRGVKRQKPIKGANGQRREAVETHYQKPIKGLKVYCPGDWRPQQANWRQ
eukprot:CAMPEP_0201136420 /NCGR_PEP_ID=MMETSP0850-20130426/54875_1 /ASSEMBLY_ACC=CAM_ASM_000622 /TAXON_ID=183588 /ORGANISM="Pseudo-nitzschia fraudulenta, Strain WWA7" /LENGTH=143 /DNA_ID=CAMNT_0047407719 /DNA_START=853 /DNA_END=1284 /DNA_ORIENTATION=-